MSGCPKYNSDKVLVGGSLQKNKKKDSSISKSSENANKQRGGIVFTKCHHNVAHPVANNAFVLPKCELCKIDEYFKKIEKEENEAFAKLKIKMEADEKNKRVTIYYIKNSYIELSATIPQHLVSQHTRLANFIQTFILLIIIFIFVIMIISIIYNIIQ